jgi:hypothetical protein
MYSVHQEILTPVRITPLAPIDHYYSVVHVLVGGVRLYYKLLTATEEVRAYGEERTKQRVSVKLRRGIMYEIEAHLFKIDAYGEPMRPQL